MNCIKSSWIIKEWSGVLLIRLNFYIEKSQHCKESTRAAWAAEGDAGGPPLAQGWWRAIGNHHNELTSQEMLRNRRWVALCSAVWGTFPRRTRAVMKRTQEKCEEDTLSFGSRCLFQWIWNKCSKLPGSGWVRALALWEAASVPEHHDALLRYRLLLITSYLQVFCMENLN